MPHGQASPRVDRLRAEALAAARGLSSGESALVGVLRDLEQERSRAAEAYRAVVGSLAAALEARDGYTGEHSNAVHDLSVAVASRLGLGVHEVAEVEAVALLHDIGKIGIPDGILHKPGPLTSEEWALMREHPVIGERILRPLPGLADVATAVRHEHERWDGTGYPDGLAGEDIPLASRIVLACDAYNALVSDRPYRQALSDQEATAELRRCTATQFDPAVVEALLACLAAPATPREHSSDDLARALVEPATTGERRLERELHALIAIASSVAAAHRLDDVLEVAAEQARTAIGAASLSISRWEAQRQVLRTLINAGELAPGEEHLPTDEVYRLDHDELLRRLLEDGEPYTTSLDDPDVVPLERDLLVASGKHHAAAVPIVFAGTPWGELWATRTRDEQAFDARDVRFLEAICAQVAGAVGRAELFSHMAELAFEDPLTGVANRRAVDERLDLWVPHALRTGGDLAVLLCDVDNLKELNDAHGHSAGDQTLVRVATVLREASDRFGTPLVARVGGDEFCVLLEGCSAEEAAGLGERVIARLAADDRPRVSVSCGVASVGLGARRVGDLLRAADAAQYTAKRGGRARVCVAGPAIGNEHWTAQRTERRAIRGRARPQQLDVASVLDAALSALDGPLAGRVPLDRTEAVALAVGEALDASACTVSWCPAGTGVLETVFLDDRRMNRTSGHRFGAQGSRYAVADFPQTERIMAGGAFVVAADDPEADAAERRLLADWGMTGVLAAAGTSADGTGWLVEIYADAGTGPLADAEHPLRLLLAEALRGAAPQALRAVS